MALDPALESAIFEAAEKEGQPRTVALRLVAWLKALSTGETSEEQDRESHSLVLNAVELNGNDYAD